ncbi:MAG: zf-HC2 domain-containing protein [Clostridia bacterium]|nr:zf-HC2 domain-containing protein [Clostridia bacterium]NCC43941.1 zf-HC2 domain-containing protein [Clostridia bacterium]
MKCEEALMKIDDYINDSLSFKETEEFLEHVRGCPECYDELEIYFTIYMGMKYLEEEKLETYNIPQMLKNDMMEKERAIRRRKLLAGTLFAFCLIFGVGIAISLMLYLGHIELPKLL